MNVRQGTLAFIVGFTMSVVTVLGIRACTRPGTPQDMPTPEVSVSAPAPMATDCRFDDTCPGDFTMTVIGGWPTDPYERCLLAMDMAGLANELCEPIRGELG